MKYTDNELQAAIDAALIEIKKEVSGSAFAACPKNYPVAWSKESPARLALAKAFLARFIAAARGESVGINGLTEAEEANTAPSTFEAHGKVWTRHIPGDPIPCDREAIIEIIDTQGNIAQSDGVRYRPRRARSNVWKHTKGWRYADESDNTDWKTRAEKAESELSGLLEAANEESRKEHVKYAQLANKLEAAQAELAALKSYQLGIIRPLADAGPVPDGCVRVTAFNRPEDDYWAIGDLDSEQDTHFADIRLPVTETPAPTINDQPKQQVPLGPEEKLQAIKDILESK